MMEIRDRIIGFERIPAHLLKPHPDNPREHPDNQRAAVTAAINEIGFADALVVRHIGTDPNEFQILDGHLRADMLGDFPVPCLIVDLDDAEAAKFITTHDPLAGMAEYDMAKLEALTVDLTFDAPELDGVLEKLRALGPPAEVEEVETPEPPKADPITKPGDVWRCGRHRVLCGDCRIAEDVGRLMDGQQAVMVFTDPPYNHGSEDKGVAASVSQAHAELKQSEWDSGFEWASVSANVEAVMADDCTVYVCASWHTAPDIWAWMGDHSFGCCVWHKQNPMPSLMKRHWTWASELICYATYGKHTFNFPAEGHASNVWTIIKQSDGTHPTQKPVAVPAQAISHSSSRGDLVVDLFLGSGTTMLAAEQLNRVCYGIEISPAYCDVICQRYLNLTGASPTRESDGAKFSEQPCPVV